MSLIKSYLHTKMTDNLEMLTAREQLMEDIDSIIDGYFSDDVFMRLEGCGDTEFRCHPDQLTRILCDAVCKNFPTK